MPGESEASARTPSGGRGLTEDARRTDPDEQPPSSVRASAPTIQSDSGEKTPQRPVMIRTPIPPAPSALDAVVPQLSTTTPTGRNSPSGSPSSTMRSGAASGRSLIGISLGRYEILEELGHGGMATVYRARDPRLERDVALKVIHRHLRDNPEIAQRFRHEAKAVAKLKHPAIVEIYDVPDIEDEERFLVAELVDGPSLRKYLTTLRTLLGENEPPMPPEVAASFVMQVLSALDRAHQEGIVHRDVKPENILIANISGPNSQRPSDPARTPPVAKLTDFGIAKILDAQGMTSTGQILGSPAHMAPEQIEGGEIGPRVDIFATGVLFYELLTGRLPFDGKNPAQVIRRVLDGDFTPADRVVQTVGGRWNAILSQMLARDLEKRPVNIEALMLLMRRELDAMGITDPDRTVVEFVRDPVAVTKSFSERLKPRLLARAAEARDAGDVVGAANDLNRALAYDPSDPKLVRAVTSLRSRERRMRTLKRAVPILVAAALVSGGTFGVVRWARTKPIALNQSASLSIAPLPSVSVSTSSSKAAPVPSPSTPRDAGASPSTTSSAPLVASIEKTPSPPDAGPSYRKVMFVLFPSGKFSIDSGGNEHDGVGAIELSVGEHKIEAYGTGGCCEKYVAKFKVEPGEEPQQLSIKFKIKAAILNAGDISEGGQITRITVKSATGVEIAAGAPPLSVPVSDPKGVTVNVTIEGTGFPAKKTTITLLPGDVVSVP